MGECCAFRVNEMRQECPEVVEPQIDLGREMGTLHAATAPRDMVIHADTLT